jgi:hypothetical protein
MKINESHFTIDTGRIRDEIRRAAQELRSKGAKDSETGTWTIAGGDNKLHVDVQLAILKDCYDKLGNIFPI